MVARVTLAEIDTTRLSVASATERYRTSVIPALEQQPGYAGSYVLATPEGKALVVTLWQSEEAAAAAVANGHYGDQLAKFATSFRAPYGRESYEVVLADPSGLPGVDA
jgi:heme-degrading monooxygenase HmoA